MKIRRVAITLIFNNMNKLNEEEMKHLESNSLSIQNAIALGNYIKNDPTVGGIFPNNADGSGNFTNANEAIFKDKYCKYWKFIRPVLILAKTFTGPAIDIIIDALIALGDKACKS